MSDHPGSVWLHGNAPTGEGMARCGFPRETPRIFKGLFVARTYIALKRLPKLFCGFPRPRFRGPTVYPVACSPKARFASAAVSLLRLRLGISLDPVGNFVAFRPRTYRLQR